MLYIQGSNLTCTYKLLELAGKVSIECILSENADLSEPTFFVGNVSLEAFVDLIKIVTFQND